MSTFSGSSSSSSSRFDRGPAARGESEQGRSAPRDVVSGHSEREKSVGGRRAGKTQTADHQRNHGSKDDGPDRHSEPFVDYLDDAREWQPVVSGKRPDLSGKRGQNRRRTQPLANRRERHDTDGPLFPQGVVADLSKREAGLGVEHSSNVRLHAGHQAQHARPAAKCTNPDCADDTKRNSVRCVLGLLGHVHRRVECADRPDSRHPRKTELPAGAPVRVALDMAENEPGVSSAKVRLGRSDRQSHQKDEHHQRVGDSRHRLQGGHVTAAHTGSDGSHDHARSKNRVRSALCHVEVAVFLDHHDGQDLLGKSVADTHECRTERHGIGHADDVRKQDPESLWSVHIGPIIKSSTGWNSRRYLLAD
ncbi:hypothetical protein KL943_005083 [Ogataea angusta]|nr:hypothetical protein KL943_005083 [Ogataea angusta]